MTMKHNAKKNQQRRYLRIFILASLIILIFILFSTTKYYDQINHALPVVYGVTYSPVYATALGLDPKAAYSRMFKDLNLKKIRLSAYWDEIEPRIDEYDFTNLDFLRLARTFFNAKGFFYKFGGRRRFQFEIITSVLVNCNFNRNDKASLLLGLRIKFFAELRDINSVLGQRGSYRRRWSCRSG